MEHVPGDGIHVAGEQVVVNTGATVVANGWEPDNPIAEEGPVWGTEWPLEDLPEGQPPILEAPTANGYVTEDPPRRITTDELIAEFNAVVMRIMPQNAALAAQFELNVPDADRN
ncbi:hypothetical protein R1sor_025353 [Riccia sorocarpa]|uniref:Uncharacterized protein n=1 Tax=Riccia sorocarpa TaxID=122646 RepID=A0ABD3G8E2_9MARC